MKTTRKIGGIVKEKYNSYIRLFLLFSLAILNGIACCDILLGRVNDWGGVGSAQLLQGIRYSFIFEYQSPTEQIFASDIFSPADAGKTFSVTFGSPGFENVAGRLTNGFDEPQYLRHDIYYIRNGQTLYAGSGIEYAYESSIEKYVESYGPDFTAYVISKIDLQINTLLFASPGSNPNGNGIWSESNYDITYNIYGFVFPEPATLSLLAFGGLVLLRKRK